MHALPETVNLSLRQGVRVRARFGADIERMSNGLSCAGDRFELGFHSSLDLAYQQAGLSGD